MRALFSLVAVVVLPSADAVAVDIRVRMGHDTSNISGSDLPPAPHIGDSPIGGPVLTPVQFLLMSSPSERRVVYAELENFRSVGELHSLVDSGLGSPHGIALDRQRGFLYVADLEVRKVFRYSIVVQENENPSPPERQFSLITEGSRLTVLEGKNTTWVAVDSNTGDLFYSDQEVGSVNRVPFAILERLAMGDLLAAELHVATESQQEAEAAAALSATLAGASATVATAVDDQPPHVLALYEASGNPKVSSPAGIATDGLSVYWANHAEGRTRGTVLQGDVAPEKRPRELAGAGGSGPAPFVAETLANNSHSALGIMKTHNLVIYTERTRRVYGIYRTGGEPVIITSGLDTPRGLAWDGDNTIYVADQGGSAVWSVPVGRLAANQPRTRTADFHDAFGLALLHSADPAFALRSGALRAAPYIAPLALATVLAAWLST